MSFSLSTSLVADLNRNVKQILQYLNISQIWKISDKTLFTLNILHLWPITAADN